MGIKLSTSDQIKLLRETAHNINERVRYLRQVDFDECLLVIIPVETSFYQRRIWE